MLKRNKRDNESFVREKTIETMKTNTFLKASDIVLIANGEKAYCFYEIVESSTQENKIQLTNGLYAVLINDPIRFTKEEIENKFIENNKIIQSSIDLKEDKTSVENIKNEINEKLDTKFDKSSVLNLGNGLKGSPDFNSNININMDYLTEQETDSLLNEFKKEDSIPDVGDVSTLQQKSVNGLDLVKTSKIMAKYSDFNDKGIIGKCDGVFPLTSAIANNIYYLPSNGKYYKCNKNYSGNQLTVPNANFVDISVLQNSDRLENLYSLNWATLKNLPIAVNTEYKYTIDKKGIVFYQLHGFNKRTAYFKINGILISTAYYETDNNSELISSNIIVNKDDVIEYKTSYFPTVENKESFIRFVPFK